MGGRLSAIESALAQAEQEALEAELGYLMSREPRDGGDYEEEPPPGDGGGAPPPPSAIGAPTYPGGKPTVAPGPYAGTPAVTFPSGQMAGGAFRAQEEDLLLMALLGLL